MEKFKTTLRRRISIIALYNVTTLIISTYGYTKNISDFMKGFQTGIFLGIQFLLIVIMFKYVKALRDEEKLKILYIAENDERRKFINSQIGGIGINIALSGLAVATIISGFYNTIIFLTLFGSLIFLVLVKGCLKLYYNIKY